MKSFFSSFCLFTLLLMAAKAAAQAPSYANRWVEYKRIEGKKSISFTDTLYLSKTADAILLRRGSFATKAGLHAKHISFGLDSFAIAKKGRDIILSTKWSKHYLGQAMLDATAQQVQSHRAEQVPLSALKQVDAAAIVGQWRVYKRERANPDAAFHTETLISRLSVEQSGQGYKVLLNTYGSPSHTKYTVADANVAPWVLEQGADVPAAPITVYKAGSKELVFGFLDIIYYLVPDVVRK